MVFEGCRHSDQIAFIDTMKDIAGERQVPCGVFLGSRLFNEVGKRNESVRPEKGQTPATARSQGYGC